MTSTLKRTIATARHFTAEKIAMPTLDEIDAGLCDGMTYDSIARALPEEFAARAADKLHYRYPRGESYMDVIQRLEVRSNVFVFDNNWELFFFFESLFWLSWSVLNVLFWLSVIKQLLVCCWHFFKKFNQKKYLILKYNRCCCCFFFLKFFNLFFFFFFFWKKGSFTYFNWNSTECLQIGIKTIQIIVEKIFKIVFIDCLREQKKKLYNTIFKSNRRAIVSIGVARGRALARCDDRWNESCVAWRTWRRRRQWRRTCAPGRRSI